MTDPLLRVSSLRISYETGRSWAQFRARTFDAVRDVSFDIHEGETFGLVGESGSGKSTTGRAILRLLEPAEGTIHFDGHEVTAFGRRTPMWYRRAVQIVFQDPLSSLNPRRTVGDALRSAIRQAQQQGPGDRSAVGDLLERVGLDDHHAARLPRELSGGQRQRVAIARAIAMRPRLIVCDEAVSALDVSTQSQVLNLLDDLQRDLGLSYLFIAHDLSVVRHVSHHIGVMYLGRLVEVGPAESVYTRPLHPYTQMLLEAVPVPDPAVQRQRRSMRRRASRNDQSPSPLNPPTGCAFHTRCRLAIDQCRTETPPVRTDAGQHYRCHLPPDQTQPGLPIVHGEPQEDR